MEHEVCQITVYTRVQADLAYKPTPHFGLENLYFCCDPRISRPLKGPPDGSLKIATLTFNVFNKEIYISFIFLLRHIFYEIIKQDFRIAFCVIHASFLKQIIRFPCASITKDAWCFKYKK